MSEADSKPEASKPWVPPHLRHRSGDTAADGSLLNTSSNPRFRTYSSRMIAAHFGNPNDGTLTPDPESPDRLSRILIFEGQHPGWPSKIFVKTNLWLLNKPVVATTTTSPTDERKVEEKKEKETTSTTTADDVVENKLEKEGDGTRRPSWSSGRRRDSRSSTTAITITDEMQDYLSHGNNGGGGAEIPLFTQQVFPSSGGGKKNWGGKSDDTKFEFTGWYTVEKVQVLRKGSQELIEMLGEKWYQSGKKRPDEIGESDGGVSGSGSRSGGHHHGGGYGKWRRGRRGSFGGGESRDKYSHRRRGSDEPSKADSSTDIAKDEARVKVPAEGNAPTLATTAERNLPVPSESDPSSSSIKEEVGPLSKEKDTTLTENDKPTQAKDNNESSQPEDSTTGAGTGTTTTGTGNGIGVAMTTDNTINGPRDPAVLHKLTQRLEDTKYRTGTAWRRSLGVDWAVVTLKKNEDRTDNPMDGFEYVDNEPEEINKKDRKKYTRKNEARNEDGSDEGPKEKKPVAADPQPDMPQSPDDDDNNNNNLVMMKKDTSGTIPIDDYLTGKYGTVKGVKEFTSPTTATTTTASAPPPPEDLASSVSSVTPSQSASKVLGNDDDSPTVPEFADDSNNIDKKSSNVPLKQKHDRKIDNDDDDDTDYQTYGTEKLIEHRTPRPTIISPVLFSKRKDSTKDTNTSASAVTSPGGAGEFGEDSLVDDFSAVGLSSDADTSIIDAGRDDEEESECWSELSNSVTTVDKNWTVIDRE